VESVLPKPTPVSHVYLDGEEGEDGETEVEVEVSGARGDSLEDWRFRMATEHSCRSPGESCRMGRRMRGRCPRRRPTRA
jgi:hypothetical protein